MNISQDQVKKILLDNMLFSITGIKPFQKPVRNVPKINYNEGLLSPKSKMLLNLLTPISREKLKKQFMEDDMEAMEMEEDIEDMDPLYSYFESTEIGAYMEFWICHNMKCQCGSKFMKYINVNKPIVDIRCVNPAHKLEHGPKFYQVKTTLSGNIFNGYTYFSMKDQNIFVGSKKKGYYAHYLKPTDNLETLIGYICIEYKKINDTTIKIDLDRSFVVSPDMLNKIDDFFYNYIVLSGNDAIKYNTNMCNVYTLRQLYNGTNMIDVTQKYDTIMYKEEDSKIAIKLFNKYYKYKMKYMKLKNIFINDYNNDPVI